MNNLNKIKVKRKNFKQEYIYRNKQNKKKQN